MNKSKEEMFELFQSMEKKHYVKSGKFLYRPASTAGETVITTVGGKIKTIKKCLLDDFILRNIEIGSSGETYSINHYSFLKKYDIVTSYSATDILIDGVYWGLSKAKGEILSFQYFGEDFNFMAPWNGEMICKNGDYIASPVNGDPNDIYRIEEQTFYNTYKLKE